MCGVLNYLHSKGLYLIIGIVLHQNGPQAYNQIPVYLDGKNRAPYCAERKWGVPLKEENASLLLPVTVSGGEFAGVAE